MRVSGGGDSATTSPSAATVCCSVRATRARSGSAASTSSTASRSISVDGVERPRGEQIVDVVAVHAHSTTPSEPSALASRLRPRRSRDLAVPS